MLKFKHGDRVKVVNDRENDGFYNGAEGTVMEYSKVSDDPYGVLLDKIQHKYFYCKEDEIEKINGQQV